MDRVVHGTLEVGSRAELPNAELGGMIAGGANVHFTLPSVLVLVPDVARTQIMQ